MKFQDCTLNPESTQIHSYLQERRGETPLVSWQEEVLGVMTTEQEVAIFWDIENCPPPRGVSANSVESRIRQAIREFGRIYQINAYGELARFPEQMRMELQRSGIHLIDTPHGSQSREKDVADHMIITDMLVFAIQNPPPNKIVLVSGDSDYAYTLAKLRQLDYEVILVVPPFGVSSILRERADVLLEWNEIMGLEREVIEDTQLRFEPLLTAITELEESGIGEPSVSDVTHLLSSKYPTWRKISGHSDVEEYVEEAADRGVVMTWKDDEVARVRVAEDESDFVLTEMTRFDPLVRVIVQFAEDGNEEPELAQIGLALRIILPNPYEKLGVNRLKDYVLEAEDAGVVNVRQDGLQHYVSLAKEEPDEPLNLQENPVFDLLERALASLREDMIAPTTTAIIDRMCEIKPSWSLRRSPYQDARQLFNAAVEHREAERLVKDSEVLLFPEDGKFDYIDPADETKNYTTAEWIAFYEFLLTQEGKWVRGRYKYAKLIQKVSIEELENLKLGHLIHMVQLAINESSLGLKSGSWNHFIPIVANIEVLLSHYKKKDEQE